ncbi:MAG: exosortase system-associated protein, TIGR04073 family [Candidatus Omnitrophota bacterium]
MKKKSVLAIFVAVSLFLAAYPSGAHANGPLRKLGRGIANVLTFPFEIVQQMNNTFSEEGGAAALTVGALKGVSMAALRAAAGVYEVATFPFPIPSKYRPIMRYPEFFFKNEEFSDINVLIK